MNKMDIKFKELKEVNKKAIIPFIAIGSKDLNETIEFVDIIEQAGADMVNLGIPYSDPLADGPIIEDAYNDALLSGIKVSDIIQCIGKITLNNNIPIIVTAYYNTIYCRRVKKFINELADMKVSGLIIPDIPMEERGELTEVCKERDISLISIVTASSKERIKKITNGCDSFIYCLTGIKTNVKEYLQEVRENSNLPICIAKDNYSLEYLKSIGEYYNGVIIGSDLVKIINSKNDFSERKEEIIKLIKKAKENI